LKLLNIKLFDRCQQLQAIIDEEAAAHTFYHDYPPKSNAGMSERDSKIAKIYEEKIETLNRSHERRYNSLAKSAA